MARGRDRPEAEILPAPQRRPQSSGAGKATMADGSRNTEQPMEATTPFDLNQAIQRWRENLGQSPAFRSENLFELESHLRDSIATLQRQGLSDEEALLVTM